MGEEEVKRILISKMRRNIKSLVSTLLNTHRSLGALKAWKM